MQILLVEDDADTRLVLVAILRSAGHQVEEAVDGADALERLRRGSHPSLIILDMMMPRLDGEGFMKAQRSESGLSDIPVVIMSGHQAAAEKAAELGAAGCLVKPIGLQQLIAVVEGLFPPNESAK